MSGNRDALRGLGLGRGSCLNGEEEGRENAVIFMWMKGKEAWSKVGRGHRAC